MTITLTREEAQQVLDALTKIEACLDKANEERLLADTIWMTDHETLFDFIANESETLRARFAQPEPEPVACKQCGAKGIHACIGYRWEEGRIPPSVTFTAPPQREWVGLTDDDRQELAAEQHGWEGLCSAVEAKLREKNA